MTTYLRSVFGKYPTKQEVWDEYGSGEPHSWDTTYVDGWHCDFPDGTASDFALAYDPRCRSCLIGAKAGLVVHPDSGFGSLTNAESMELVDEMLADLKVEL